MTEPRPPRPRPRELALGLALPAALLGAPATLVGLADPFELNAADVARRAALHLLHAPWLALAGAENRLPTRGDVGRGELPTLAIALAQRLAGLGPVTARAPALAAGLAGLAALWLWARRVAGPRAAACATWALATMPLYAAQSRTVDGDAPAMAALVASFAGLTVLCFDDHVRGAGAAGWGLTALAGLVAGVGCRGAVFGLAVPLVGVGAAACLTRSLAPAAAPRSRRRAALAPACLAVGVASAAAGAAALARRRPLHVSYALGAASFEGLRYPTFDQTLSALGHGLFPWSALLPAAFALLASPPAALRLAADPRTVRYRVALVLAAGASYAAHAWLAPATGTIPFVGVGLLAACLALGLDELGRRRAPWRVAALATASLVLLLALDFRRLPGATLAALALPGASLPEGVAARAASLWTLCALLVAPPALLALWPPRLRTPRARSAPRAAPHARFAPFGRPWPAPGRDRLVLVGGVAAALVPCWGLYPDLAARWSPRGAFASYRRLRGAGEPLGLVSVASRSPIYYGEPEARSFADAASAIAWLADAPVSARRWLLVRAPELPELNALWRARAPAASARNLPVLDARSGYVYVATSSLRDGERDESPLGSYVGDEPPPVARPVSARLGDELEALGWALYENGRPVDQLARGRDVELRVWYRVLATPAVAWRAFVHLEGGAQRHTAEHAFDAYPMSLWQAGDIITDSTTLRLGPNFSPGAYSLFFGLFRGEARLPVGPGGAGGDRVAAGTLRVH